MFFRYKTASLEYDTTNKEYVHPATGERVRSVMECLNGWKEPDQAMRLNWGTLVRNIQEFWERPESSSQIMDADKIDFAE